MVPRPSANPIAEVAQDIYPPSAAPSKGFEKGINYGCQSNISVEMV